MLLGSTESWICDCLCCSHPNASGLEAAKKLTESLLETVRYVDTFFPDVVEWLNGGLRRWCYNTIWSSLIPASQSESASLNHQISRDGFWVFYSYWHSIWSNTDEGMCLPTPQQTLCFIILQVRAEHARMVSIYTATGSTQCEFSFSARNWMATCKWCIFFTCLLSSMQYKSTHACLLSFQHTLHKVIHLTAVTLTRGLGTATQPTGTLVPMQRTLGPVVTGVTPTMAPQVMRTWQQPLNLLRLWFSIQFVLDSHILILSR